MFIVTIINFLLFTLTTGAEIAMFIVLIRKALISDLLSETQELVDNPFQNLTLAIFWSANLPVSRNLSLLHSVSIHAR